MMRVIFKRLMMRRKPVMDMSVFVDGRLILRAYRADTFYSRMLGLHALPELFGYQSLIIRPCHAVHTIGLSYHIDVLFLASCGRVMKAVSLPPGRAAICIGATQVIEAVAGTIDKFQLHEGTVLTIESGAAMLVAPIAAPGGLCSNDDFI